MTGVLHGWEAVRRWFAARGVHVGVRTLQRWKVQHGLPVDRKDWMRCVVASPARLLHWWAATVEGDEDRRLASSADDARQKASPT